MLSVGDAPAIRIVGLSSRSVRAHPLTNGLGAGAGQRLPWWCRRLWSAPISSSSMWPAMCWRVDNGVDARIATVDEVKRYREDMVAPAAGHVGRDPALA